MNERLSVYKLKLLARLRSKLSGLQVLKRKGEEKAMKPGKSTHFSMHPSLFI